MLDKLERPTLTLLLECFVTEFNELFSAAAEVAAAVALESIYRLKLWCYGVGVRSS